MADCHKCEGRGFMWRRQQITKNNVVIADMVRQGGICTLCSGTGKANRTVDYIVGLAIVAGIVTFFYMLLLL